jgi:hypothetical protein
MHQQRDPNMENCIKLCWECRDTCQDTLYNHNLERGGDHIDADNIRLMSDCIQVCQIAADFMRRNSTLHTSTCAACADVCEACAESCEAMGSEHVTIQRCAEICRRCAKSCREMSQMKKAA